MNLNWGTGIAIFIIFFLMAVVAFVIFTSQQEYQLVEENYYPQELKYGETIQKMENTNSLDERITLSRENEAVVVTFPSITKGKSPEGKIHIYRPSDERKDLLIRVNIDSIGRQIINTAQLIPGKYIFKIEWQLDGTVYYQELDFVY